MSNDSAFHTLKASIQAAQEGADPYKDALWSLINYPAQMRAYQQSEGELFVNVANKPPGWENAFDEAQKAWAEMPGRLSDWAARTLNNVIALPTYLVDTNDETIIPTLQAAIAEVDLLIKDINNASVNERPLQATLPLLRVQFNEFSEKTKALIQSLESQAAVFDWDAQTLRSVAEMNASADLRRQADDVQQFAGLVDRLKSALSVVIQPWQSAEDYFTQTISTLTDLERMMHELPNLLDLGQRIELRDVKHELQQIENGWSTLMTTVNQMLLDATASNASP